MGRFDDIEDDDLDGIIQSPSPRGPEVEHGLGANKIITYGYLNKRKCPNEQVNIKVPLTVVDFINTNAEPGHVKALIYAQMLEIGHAYMARKLVTGDYEIKY